MWGFFFSFFFFCLLECDCGSFAIHNVEMSLHLGRGLSGSCSGCAAVVALTSPAHLLRRTRSSTWIQAQSSQPACTHSFPSFAKSLAPPRSPKAGELNPHNFCAALLRVRAALRGCVGTGQLLGGKEVPGTLLLW